MNREQEITRLVKSIVLEVKQMILEDKDGDVFDSDLVIILGEHLTKYKNELKVLKTNN